MDKLVAVIATAHLEDNSSCVIFIAQGPALAGFDRDKWLESRQASLKFLHVSSVSFSDVRA